ncbi:MAG: asparagine--tRNA ligase [Candidatus Zixiibacteriota bacterium]
MSETILIRDAGKYAGEMVTVRGWLTHKRSHGKISFIDMRDGTGFMQGVMAKKDVSEDIWNRIEDLTLETSLAMTGKVNPEKRAPGGYELHVNDLKVYQIADEFPIQPKEHGIDFLLSNRHLWLRSKQQVAILKIRDSIIYAIREFFKKRQFVLVDSPILTSSVGESSSTLFSTEYFDLGKAYLAQTGQLYLEAAIYAHNLVYCFGPTFRAEKSKTRRHLTEFWMVEGEQAFYDNDENMELQEDMITYIVNYVLENNRAELEILERDIEKLEAIKKPFKRLPYDDAIDYLKQQGSEIQWGSDLGAADETLISSLEDSPTFVINYPKKAKAFYMKEHPERDDLVLCSDLLAPEGYGEIIGGSQREEDPDKLIRRIKKEGLDPKAYGWYLDLRKYGSVPHSGFGLGIERTVAWITGRPHVREMIPFPRMIHHIYP